MAEDVDSECYDLLEQINFKHGDENVPALIQHSHESAPSHPSTYIPVDLSDDHLTLKNVQFSRPPAKDICSLAVSTFEKMDLENLRTLEKLSDQLKSKGHVGLEELKAFTTEIMSEVWECDEELAELLRSDPLLTQTLGKELLVLFDNVMSDPVYETSKTGKPQRYTKACLDNSIQPIYEENVPENRWDTFETVISTYTSPTAFTPEMESLMRTAARLGISTNDLNLKKFVTERSLSAFLKTLIQAKLKKEAFIKKFNNKLLGVLHHLPNLDDTGVVNKFKYSFSRLYQYFDPRINSKSSPEFHHTSKRQNSTGRIDKTRYSIHKRDPSAIGRIGDSFKTMSGRFKTHNSKKNDHTATICHKCHEPYREDSIGERNIVRSMSDICLSLPSCESITDCQCFDDAKKTWDKRQAITARTVLISSHGPYNHTPDTVKQQRNKRSKLKSSIRTPAKALTEEKGCFGLLTEQRSFFRLGEGALRDALSEYVETKNTNGPCTSTKATMKKKKVRWLDETSISSIYGSLLDSKSDLNLLNKHSPYQSFPEMQTFTEKLIGSLFNEYNKNSGAVALAEKPLNRVFTKAIIQATFVALVLWICFVLYSRTPDVAEKLRQLISTSWLYHLKRKPIL